MGKRGPGHPPVEVDLELITKLATTGHPWKEIGWFMGCSYETLRKRADTYQAYLRGKAQRRKNIREWQNRAAEAGNAQILIWIGANECDQHKDGPREGITENFKENLQKMAKSMDAAFVVEIEEESGNDDQDNSESAA